MAAAALGGPGVAHAQDVDVAPFLGYRFGGAARGEQGKLLLPSSALFGAALHFLGDDGTRVEVRYTQHTSALQLRTSGPGSERTLFDVTARSVEGGALYRRRGPWIERHLVFTVGVSNWAPAEPRRSQEWALLATAGAGLTAPVQAPVRARVEGRVSYTSIRGPDALFCTSGTGCAVSLTGSAIWQGQLTVALLFAF